MSEEVKATEAKRMPAVTTIKLVSPLVTHKGSVSDLQIRAPKAREIVKMKVKPHTYYLDGRFITNEDVIMGYLELLTDHDRSVLEDLSAPDWNKAGEVIRDYVTETGN